MRLQYLAAAAAFTLAAAPAPAGACCLPTTYSCCQAAVDYGAPPADYVNPFYVVNHGPVYTGPGIYTYNNVYVPSVPRRAYWEGGYVDAEPSYYSYPHVTPYPYVRGFHGYRHGYRGGTAYSYRPYRHAPYAAHRYRPAPSARVISVPSNGY